MQSSNTPDVSDRIVNRLAELLGPERYARFFEDAAAFEYEGERVCIAVPSAFHADWLGRRFGSDIETAARMETGDAQMELRWSIEPSRFNHGDPPEKDLDAPAAAPPSSAPAASRGFAWRGERNGCAGAIGFEPASDRYDLDDFIVGECNRLAHTVAQRIVACDETPGLQLLVMHGDCGLGKTHLLHGIARRFHATHPGARVRYVTGEAFTNEYIRAVRAGKIEEFRQSLRRIDLLCLDDMHFFAGKDGTQSEFMHTFEALDMQGARVVLASDMHPRQINNLNQRLASMCSSGVVVQLEAPDFETRLRALRRLAALRGLFLDEAQLSSIADACCGSFRDLCGVMTRLQAMATLTPEGAAEGRITPSLVDSVLTGYVRPSARRPVRVEEILDAVCAELTVEPSDVLGRGRHRRVVLARGVTAFLSRDMTTFSYPEIGRSMNRPNHSTIVTAARRVERQIESGGTCTVGSGMYEIRLSELCQRIRQSVLRRPHSKRGRPGGR